MDIRPIQEINDTGIARAFYTVGSELAWNKATAADAGLDESDVLANYEELAALLGVSTSRMVRPSQTHTIKVRVVSNTQGGEGVIRPACEESFDALVTNEPGLVLCTLQADCAPVYLLDPVARAIGMVHSGRKGTALEIVSETLHTMEHAFGTRVCDVIAVMGPQICGSCYEVSADLRDEFKDHFSDAEIEEFFVAGDNDKAHVDCERAIRISLVRAGVLPENIHDCNCCTYETLDLPSYRRDDSLAFRMLTGIMLTDENTGAKPVKLWLDDVREAPAGYVHCRSVNAAKHAITACERAQVGIDVIDCDHDLGIYATDGGDGLSLLDWLAEQGKFYPIALHTMNPVGRENMQRVIDRYWPKQ